MRYRRQAIDDIAMHSSPTTGVWRDLLWIGFMMVTVVAIVFAVVYGAGVLLTQYISIDDEVKLQKILNVQPEVPATNADIAAIELYLNTLAIRLYPEYRSIIHVHYSADRQLNAYATLAGNIVVYQGLLTEVKSENELAMVLAHEIGHLKLRHPIAGVGSTVASALVNIMLGAANNALPGLIGGSTTHLSSLSFSRRQELSADAFALHRLQVLYGHCGGGVDFFKRLEQSTTNKSSDIALFNTHPTNAKRINTALTLCTPPSSPSLTAIPRKVAQAIYRQSVAVAPPLKEKTPLNPTK